MWLTLRSLALACTFALAACSGGDAASDPPPSDNQTTNGQPGPLLYEIANADGEIEGWMLGTIHALPDGAQWRTPKIDQIIKDADAMVVEIASLEDRETIGRLFRQMATTPGLEPLPQRVNADLRQPLRDMIELSDFAPQDLDEMESWAAAISISRVGATGRPRNGVDRFLLYKFRGRTVYGFELPGEQLGIFDALAERDQRDLLEGTVREWMNAREKPGWLTEAWLNGDVETLERATTIGIMADPELREALLTARNDRWMPTLLSKLETTDRLFVAVGTGHIVGPDGLPALLKENGFTVRRME